MHASPLATTLQSAIATIREKHGAFAPITVVVPARPNAGLARRALATAGPFMRVWFAPPSEILDSALPPLELASHREAPASWLRAVLTPLLERLASEGALGDYGQTLQSPAWRTTLAGTLRKLESEGIAAADFESTLAELPPEHDDTARLRLLYTILNAVEGAREEDGFSAPADRARNARAALSSFPGVGPSTAVGAVLVGDTDLSHPTFAFLQEWLKPRDVVRLVLPAHSHVTTSPRSLYAAAVHATEMLISSDAEGALKRVHTSLYSPTLDADAAPVDASLTFVKTPDPIREKTETVREVQRAIARGVPLDQIAIVTPGKDGLRALATDLLRADIPVTWHVGQPLSLLPAACFLRHFVAVAYGEQRLQDVYRLLTHPAASLRQALGPLGIEGKARWRRHLSDCGYAFGLDNIFRAVTSQAEDLALEISQFDGSKYDDPKPKKERNEKRLHSLKTLLGALEAVQQDAALLLEAGTLQEHARAWLHIVNKWVRASDHRYQTIAALEPLAVTQGGPPLSPKRALQELDATLEQEIPQGRITDAAVKVLSPMQLLGGEFEVVCLFGLNDGTFPPKIRQDPMLPDRLVERLNSSEAFSARSLSLPTSADLRHLEERRLAAAVGACRGQLWLSTPALEFDPERPILPSSLLLQLLTCLLGERARYSDLAQRSVTRGSRARPLALQPDDALGEGEHLAARILRSAANKSDKDGEAKVGDVDDVAADARCELLMHPSGKRLVQLHLSLNRCRRGLQPPNEWTGHVDPSVLRCLGLDGQPLSLRVLANLLTRPGNFFFRRMLNAWGPPRFDQWPPLLPKSIEGIVVASLEAVLAESDMAADPLNDDEDSDLLEETHRRIDEALRFAPTPTEDDLRSARELARQLVSSFASRHGDFAQSQPIQLEEVTLDDALPFVVSDERFRTIPDRTSGNAVVAEIGRGKPAKNRFAEEATELSLAVLALSHHQQVAGAVHVSRSSSWKATAVAFDAIRDDVIEGLRNATQNAAAGLWEMQGVQTFGFAEENLGVERGEDGGLTTTKGGD